MKYPVYGAKSVPCLGKSLFFMRIKMPQFTSVNSESIQLGSELSHLGENRKCTGDVRELESKNYTPDEILAKVQALEALAKRKGGNGKAKQDRPEGDSLKYTIQADVIYFPPFDARDRNTGTKFTAIEAAIANGAAIIVGSDGKKSRSFGAQKGGVLPAITSDTKQTAVEYKKYLETRFVDRSQKGNVKE